MLIDIPEYLVSSGVTLRCCIWIDLQVIHEIGYGYRVGPSKYRKRITIAIRIKHNWIARPSIVAIGIQAKAEACNPFFGKDQFEFFLIRTSIIEANHSS